MGKVAGDEPSLCAAEASMALKLRASVLMDEVTVVSVEQEVSCHC